MMVAPALQPVEPRHPHDLGSRRHRRAAARSSDRHRRTGREPDAPERASAGGIRPHRRRGDGAAGGPADVAPDRRGRARAEEDRPQLLHDQLRRTREQRGGRSPPPRRRSGLPALPVGRVLPGALAAAGGQHAGPRHPARRRCLQRGPDLPGASQGVGQPADVDSAADEHDRQPPAQGDGARLQPGPREAHRRRRRAARGRDRGLLVRRRERQPRDRAVGDQHRPLRGPHGPADAAPPDLRGQRHRDQRPDPGRLDPGHLRQSAAPAVRRRRR